MKISIRIKLSVFLALLLLMSVGALSFFVLQGIRENQRNAQEAYLAQQMKTSNLYIRQLYHTEDIPALADFLALQGVTIAKQLDAMVGMNVAIYDASGKEVGNSLLFSTATDTNDLLDYALKNHIAYQTVGETMDYMSPLFDVDRQVGVIRFQYPLKVYIDFYNEVKALFIRLGLAVFVLSFISGYFYFDRFAQRILKLKADVDRISLGNYGSIALINGSDEMGDLSKGIFEMKNQIKYSIEALESEKSNLQLAVEKLKVLELQQKTFIGNVSHEFKTPLTVIKAYIDLLNMYEDDPQLITDAKVNIEKEANRLYEMVDRVLRLSVLEKYDFEHYSECLDIKEIIEEICSRMQAKLLKFQIHLEMHLISAPILADRESMMHIFINLIDNSIKYNVPEGRIDIESSIVEGYVHIKISDTGYGIPIEARTKVFDPFYTIDANRSKSLGGTGLGLAIVKGLVEKQKGSIQILDRHTQGTTILIIFPLI